MAIISTKCQAPNCENQRDLKQRSSLCVMHRVRRSRHKSFNLSKEKSTESNEFFLKINRNSKAKGKICCILNCETRVYGHGTICSKHRWRKKKFGSYDLPSHIGEPTYPVVKKLPEGIVKQCAVHGDLSEDQTYKRNSNGKIISYYCKKCTRSKNIQLRYNGLNCIEDYESMVTAQDGLCAICNSPEEMRSNNKLKVKGLAIDHDHKTKKIRGLLCSKCNTGLGWFKDSIDLLESAIAYLKKHA